MRNFKKYLAFVLTVAMLVTAMAPMALAVSDDYANEARNLYDLGLFTGRSTTEYVPDLESALTRQEGAILLLRMFGLEQDALDMTDFKARSILRSEFSDDEDVDVWAAKQVAYAVEQGVIAGFPDGTFGPLEPLTGRQYVTLTLRQLGYEGFEFERAGEEYADIAGLTFAQEREFGADSPITRGTVVGISYTSLTSNMADHSGTLADRLVETGVVNAVAAEGFGVYTPPSEPEEPVLAVHEVFATTDEETRLTTVEAHVVNFEEDQTATLTLTPDEELELEDIVVEDLEISEEGHVSYTFESRLPAGTHVVVVAVEEASSTPVMFTIEAPEFAEVVELRAVDARTLEVEFNKAVDADEVSFALSREGFNLNIQEVTFNSDETIATLVLPNRFVEGEHTVKITIGEEELEEKIELGDEVIAEIEFDSDVAVLDRDDEKIVRVWYSVYNQYGEDVTDTSTITVTVASNLTATALESDGYIEIEKADDFEEGKFVTVSLLDAETGTFNTGAFLISAASKASDFEMYGLYHEDGDAPRVDDTAADFKILFRAIDQYGNNILEEDFSFDDVVINVSNKTVLDDFALTSTEIEVDGVDYIALDLVSDSGSEFNNDGTARITIISTTTGKLVNVDVIVKKALAVNTLTLGTPALAVAGEDIEVPFTALDENGESVTSVSKLNESVDFSISGFISGDDIDGDDVKFARDLETGNAKLVIDASAATNDASRTVTLIATVQDPVSVVQRSFTVRAVAEPRVISGISSDVERNIYDEETVTISADDIIFIDQYSREIEIDDEAYTVKIETQRDNVVSLSALTFSAVDGSVDLIAAERGNSRITFTLVHDGEEMSSSSFSYVAYVYDEDDISSYELGTLPVMYAVTGQSITTHAIDFDVYGIVGSQRVKLPSSEYTFTGPNALVYNNGEIRAWTHGTWDEDGETKNLSYSVVVVDKDGDPVTLNGQVLVSNIEPEVEAMSIYAAADYTSALTDRVNSSVVAVTYGAINGPDITETNKYDIVKEAVEFLDQYGVEITEIGGNYTDFKTNIGNIIVSNEERAGNNYDDGDSFRLTIVTRNAKTFVFSVEVVESF